MRQWLKAHLPYALTCAIARAINRPWMEDLQRTERLTEYAWVLGQMGQYHPDGLPILDFGYAGGYLDEALCQYGPVTGVDPRETPRIRHPNFHREWPWSRPLSYYGTCISVSTLEHLPDAPEWVARMLDCTKPEGQVLITIPCGAAPKQFRGYRLWALRELLEWPCLEEFILYRREAGYWQRLDGPFCELEEGTQVSSAAVAEHLPESSEHQVNAIGCLRLVRPAGPWPTAEGDG